MAGLVASFLFILAVASPQALVVLAGIALAANAFANVRNAVKAWRS